MRRRGTEGPLENALTIDLEEWWHPQLVRSHVRGAERTGRVVAATERLLELLARHGVRATFFCVGEVVAAQPDLARRIRDAGHEIGFHGMTHRPLPELGPDGFARELDEFADLVREVLGADARVRGFRAPTFSLDRRTAWALPLLVERGYTYDSSVFPLRGPLYGVGGAPLAPYRIGMSDPAVVDPASPLTEAPPAVLRMLGLRVPVAGGVYLRAWPLSVTLAALGRIQRERPFVLYVHPWETDSGTPRVALPAAARLATYHGIRDTHAKLDRILGEFRFAPLAEILERREGEKAC